MGKRPPRSQRGCQLQDGLPKLLADQNRYLGRRPHAMTHEFKWTHYPDPTTCGRRSGNGRMEVGLRWLCRFERNLPHETLARNCGVFSLLGTHPVGAMFVTAGACRPPLNRFY